jgi:hypothetical protein
VRLVRYIDQNKQSSPDPIPYPTMAVLFAMIRKGLYPEPKYKI